MAVLTGTRCFKSLQNLTNLKLNKLMSKFSFFQVKYLFILLTGITCLHFTEAKAQFSLIGQVRTRFELRNGLGTLSPTDAKAAFFTSQRTRLTFGYKWERVTFQTAGTRHRPKVCTGRHKQSRRYRHRRGGEPPP